MLPAGEASTKAVLTLNSFEKGKDGGGATFCDHRFYKDSAMVVALSSGWLRLDGTRRCGKMVRVTANGPLVQNCPLVPVANGHLSRFSNRD